MDCKKCKHLKRYGHISKCELFENVTQYGEIGNEPIVKDCHSFLEDTSETSDAKTYCHWRPVKKVVSRGFTRYMIATDCGRLIQYGKIKAGNEVLGEVCQKCNRLIKMHYIKGME